MNRKHCVAIIFICVVLLDNLFLQVKVWAGAPERPQIAFPRRVNGQHWKIHLMDIDGENVRQLTKGIVQDSDPSWSPDGKRIAFWSDRGNGGIYVMDADGGNLHRLSDPDSLSSNHEPSWSPNGQRIAFVGYQDDMNQNAEIYVIDVNGKNLCNLTGDAGWDGTPTWFDPEAPPYAVSTVGQRVVTWG